jgi:CBS domain-containing protein
VLVSGRSRLTNTRISQHRALAGDLLLVSRMSKRLVSQIMRRSVVTVKPEARASEVLELAASHGTEHFSVVSGGLAVGMVCADDLRGQTPETRVWQVARHPAVTVSARSSARRAAWLMETYVISSLLVTGRRGVCGIVTRAELAESA